MISLDSLRLGGPAVFEASSAELRDMGDGVACLVLTGKMNIIDQAAIEALVRAIDIVGQRFAALVVTGAGERAFSAGADLTFFARCVASQDWAAIDAFGKDGQAAYRALRFAPFPSVAAAFGLALGGGCELMLHAGRIVAHEGLAAGLPEVKVGIIPGWGGCTQLARRTHDAARAFAPISSARVSRSAAEAADNGVIGPSDRIVAGRESLLDEAKAEALRLVAAGYRPPQEALIGVGGRAARQGLLDLIDPAASDYDRHIAGELAWVLTGGDAGEDAISEAAMMDLERAVLLRLVREPRSQARIDAMLSTGKPLRN